MNREPRRCKVSARCCHWTDLFCGDDGPDGSQGCSWRLPGGPDTQVLRSPGSCTPAAPGISSPSRSTSTSLIKASFYLPRPLTAHSLFPQAQLFQAAPLFLSLLQESPNLLPPLCPPLILPSYGRPADHPSSKRKCLSSGYTIAAAHRGRGEEARPPRRGLPRPLTSSLCCCLSPCCCSRAASACGSRCPRAVCTVCAHQGFLPCPLFSEAFIIAILVCKLACVCVSSQSCWFLHCTYFTITEF